MTKKANADNAINQATTVIASAVTPTASKDVNLTSHIENVDAALKARALATKRIKTKWAAIVAILTRHEVSVPGRRPAADRIYDFRNQIRIYEEKPPVPEDIQAYEKAGIYDLRELSREKETMKLLEAKFTGISEYFDYIVAGCAAASVSPKLDKEATKTALAEFDKAAKEYVEAIEAYDETTESVANVKEYIGIMKEVADISAIAQGLKGQG